MLNVDKKTIINFDSNMLNKHKTTIRLISILMFIAGVLCLSFPFVSGDIISIIVGILLICAGLALMVGLFTHRQHNFWPVVGGFLVAIAYLLIGYFFLRAPEVGIFAIAAFWPDCSASGDYSFDGLVSLSSC